MGHNSETTALEDNPQIFITKPVLVFKLLRNFGHMIRNLGINFRKLNAKICTEMENYLAKYCAESLQRLSHDCNRTKIPFYNLPNPLKNVIALTIETTSINKQDHIQFLNEINLPNLRHLFIFDGGSLQDSENIHYENIEYFTLYGTYMYPFTFGNLKHLTVTYGQINDDFCEFISNIKHLKTFRIMDIGKIDSNSFSKLLKLKNIESDVSEMIFEFKFEMCPDAIFRFLKQSRALRKLSFYACMLTGYRPHVAEAQRILEILQTISSKLDDNWMFNVIDPYRNPFAMCFNHKGFVFERIVPNE